MLFILLIIIGQFVTISTIETTLPVSIIFDGFTLESWKEQSIWNKTRTIIVYHLNEFCKNDNQCDAEYGINNIHLLDVLSHSLSSISLNITIDEPILNITMYNYTALLTSALFQTKIDIEHLHDNQLLNSIIYSSTFSTKNSVFNRTSRLLFVLLGISLVAIVFALTIIVIQKMHKHNYSRLFKIYQQTNDEHLNNSILQT